MKPISEQNFYELLDVPANAPSEAIEAAYERAMRELGPDSIATYTLVSPEESKELLSRIEDAYLTLTDPSLRAEYDATMHPPDLRALPRAEPEPVRTPEPPPVAESAREEMQQLVLAPLLEPAAVESWPVRLDAPVMGRADVGVLPDAPREITASSARAEPEPVAPPEPALQAEAVSATEAEQRPAIEPDRLLETDKIGVLSVANDDVVEEPAEAAPVEQPVEVAAAAAMTDEAPAEAARAETEAEQPAETAAAAAMVGGDEPEPVVSAVAELPVETALAAAVEAPVAELPTAAAQEPASALAEETDEASQDSAIEAAPEPAQAEVAIEPLAVPTPASRPEPPPEAPLETPPPPKEERREPPRALPRMREIGATTVINGELLRAAREGRGITLRELSDKTRIGVNHLENIEADRYAALPVAVYLRGFLMSVARELKLDPLRISKGYLETLTQAKGKQGS